MTPLVISEATVRVFIFYRDGSLCKGLFLRRKFFKLVRRFDNCFREHAFSTGWKLSNRELDTIITVSPTGYGIWVEMGAHIECDAVRLFSFEDSCASSDEPIDHLLGQRSVEPRAASIHKPEISTRQSTVLS